MAAEPFVYAGIQNDFLGYVVIGKFWAKIIKRYSAGNKQNRRRDIYSSKSVVVRISVQNIYITIFNIVLSKLCKVEGFMRM